MSAPLGPPGPAPCASCPYRRDVASGLWAASEYAKLPGYDEATWSQPGALFGCHLPGDRVCAGWAGVHGRQVGGRVLLAVRMQEARGRHGLAAAILAYVSPVPLFESGEQAAAHGLAEVRCPSPEAAAKARALGAMVARREAARARRAGKDTGGAAGDSPG